MLKIKFLDDVLLYTYHLKFIKLQMNSILQKEVNVLLKSFETHNEHKLYFENIQSIIEKNDVLLNMRIWNYTIIKRNF